MQALIEGLDMAQELGSKGRVVFNADTQFVEAWREADSPELIRYDGQMYKVSRAFTATLTDDVVLQVVFPYVVNDE